MIEDRGSSAAFDRNPFIHSILGIREHCSMTYVLCFPTAMNRLDEKTVSNIDRYHFLLSSPRSDIISFVSRQRCIAMHCLVVSHSSFIIMTYRLVLNNRSIDNLTDQYLSGALKMELGFFKYRRVPIGRNRFRTATTSSGRSNGYQPTDVFYLFFDSEEKMSRAVEKAKAIPIVSLVKYKPRPTASTRATPSGAVESGWGVPPTIHLPQEIINIPRQALSRHLKSFVNEVSALALSLTDRQCFPFSLGHVHSMSSTIVRSHPTATTRGERK